MKKERHQSNVLALPGQKANSLRLSTTAGRNAGKKDRIRNVDGIKYFNAQQIKALRRRVRDKADIDLHKGNVTGVKEWAVIDTREENYRGWEQSPALSFFSAKNNLYSLFKSGITSHVCSFFLDFELSFLT